MQWWRFLNRSKNLFEICSEQVKRLAGISAGKPAACEAAARSGSYLLVVVLGRVFVGSAALYPLASDCCVPAAVGCWLTGVPFRLALSSTCFFTNASSVSCGCVSFSLLNALTKASVSQE